MLTDSGADTLSYRRQYDSVNTLTRQEVTLADWEVARDIGSRIAELVEIFGSQAAVAERAGVYPPQVSNWVQGKKRPSKKRLERWAKWEGWPVEIFAEGGKRPRGVVNATLTPSGPGHPSLVLREVTVTPPRAAVEVTVPTPELIRSWSEATLARMTAQQVRLAAVADIAEMQPVDLHRVYWWLNRVLEAGIREGQRIATAGPDADGESDEPVGDDAASGGG